VQTHGIEQVCVDDALALISILAIQCGRCARNLEVIPQLLEILTDGSPILFTPCGKRVGTIVVGDDPLVVQVPLAIVFFTSDK